MIRDEKGMPFFTPHRSMTGSVLEVGGWPRPFGTTIIDSRRVVINMADPDKMAAVTSGGVSARLSSPHLKDQNAKWFTGEQTYWWYSDEAIEKIKFPNLR